MGGANRPAHGCAPAPTQPPRLVRGLDRQGWAGVLSQQALADVTTAKTKAADRFGDMQVDLRWSTEELGEIIDLLTEDAEITEDETEQMRPVMQDLESNIARIRELVVQLKKAEP